MKAIVVDKDYGIPRRFLGLHTSRLRFWKKCDRL